MNKFIHRTWWNENKTPFYTICRLLSPYNKFMHVFNFLKQFYVVSRERLHLTVKLKVSEKLFSKTPIWLTLYHRGLLVC